MARVIRVERLRLWQMMSKWEYHALADDLVKLPVPERILIKSKYYYVPTTLDEFTKTLTYGQRLFLARKTENDFDAMIRVIDGYYYPLVTGKKWNEENALLFGKYVLTCKVFELYPVVMQIVTLIEQMTDREYRLLHREPSKVEQAAGIEKLTVFSELTSINFLADAMRIPLAEVFTQPYNECLVRFMLEKEMNDYRDRYFKLLKEESESKSKSHVRS